MGTKFSKMG
jgi:hypothetical protein